MRWFPVAVLALGAIGATLLLVAAPRKVAARPKRRQLPESWRSVGAF